MMFPWCVLFCRLGRFRSYFSLVLVLLCVGCHPEIDSENSPDDIFQEYLESNFDTDGNGILDEEEILAVDTIICARMNIKSLGQLERFVNLKYLDCGGNHLTSLDISGNPRLESLGCYENYLDSLDASGNPRLKVLDCSRSKLEFLDVSRNSDLQVLSCWNNRLTRLDVSGSPRLTMLDCSRNELEFLDVSRNSDLQVLSCWNNRLTSLDVSGKQALKTLIIEGQNRTVEVDSNNQFDLRELSGFDVSKAYGWDGGVVEGTMLTFRGQSVHYYQIGFREAGMDMDMYVILNGVSKEE